MKTIKCAWCGATLPLTMKGRPKQHKNGTTTCGGGGQLAVAHDRLRDAAAKNQAKKWGKA